MIVRLWWIITRKTIRNVIFHPFQQHIHWIVYQNRIHTLSCESGLLPHRLLNLMQTVTIFWLNATWICLRFSVMFSIFTRTFSLVELLCRFDELNHEFHAMDDVCNVEFYLACELNVRWKFSTWRNAIVYCKMVSFSNNISFLHKVKVSPNHLHSHIHREMFIACQKCAGITHYHGLRFSGRPTSFSIQHPTISQMQLFYTMLILVEFLRLHAILVNSFLRMEINSIRNSIALE